MRNFIRFAVCLSLCALPDVGRAGVIPWLYDAVFGPHYPSGGGYAMSPPSYGAMRPAYGPSFARPRYAWYPMCAPCAVRCDPCSATACATKVRGAVRRADLKPIPDGDTVKQANEGPQRVESKRMPPGGDSPFVESQPRNTNVDEAADPDGGFQPPVKDGDEKTVIEKKTAAPTKKTPDAQTEEQPGQDNPFPKLPAETPFDPASARADPPRRLHVRRDRGPVRVVSRFDSEWLPQPRSQAPALAAGDLDR
ncbi:MAG: hypothetical protein ABGZ17_24940 [Planctomycetaceae bacterium]